MWRHRVTCLPPKNASAPWGGPGSRWLHIIIWQVSYIQYLPSCLKSQRSTPYNIAKSGLPWKRVFRRRHLGRRVTAVTCLRWPTVLTALPNSKPESKLCLKPCENGMHQTRISIHNIRPCIHEQQSLKWNQWSNDSFLANIKQPVFNIFISVKYFRPQNMLKCSKSIVQNIFGSVSQMYPNQRNDKSQRTNDVIITSLLRRNDFVTSFWRNNDVIITPWMYIFGQSKLSPVNTGELFIVYCECYVHK